MSRCLQLLFDQLTAKVVIGNLKTLLLLFILRFIERPFKRYFTRANRIKNKPTVPGESSSETENPYGRMHVTEPVRATIAVQNGARLSWDPWIRDRFSKSAFRPKDYYCTVLVWTRQEEILSYCTETFVTFALGHLFQLYLTETFVTLLLFVSPVLNLPCSCPPLCILLALLLTIRVRPGLNYSLRFTLLISLIAFVCLFIYLFIYLLI